MVLAPPAFTVATVTTPHSGSTPTAIHQTFVTDSWTGDEATNTEVAGLLTATHAQW